MDAEHQKEHDALTQRLAQLLGQQIQENRNLIGELAKSFGLEYSQDAKTFVDLGKIAELKKNPRGGK